MYLVCYTATAGMESAILIPGSPTTRHHINVNLQIWDAIANEHFAAQPQDNELCLVTDVYVTRKLAFDFTNSPELTHYIMNVQNPGEIPGDFQIRSNSATMQPLPLHDFPYVFLESHLRKLRGELIRRPRHWKNMLTQGPIEIHLTL